MNHDVQPSSAEASSQMPTHICIHETEFAILCKKVDALEQGQKTMLASQVVIEHVLIGNLSEADRRGLLEEHHEHRRTLFGDKKVHGDQGLVGDMREVRTTLQEGKWFARGASATFGFIGAMLALIGFKGLAAILAFFTANKGTP